MKPKKDKKKPEKKLPKPAPSCKGICQFELHKPKCPGCPHYR